MRKESTGMRSLSACMRPKIILREREGQQAVGLNVSHAQRPGIRGIGGHVRQNRRAGKFLPAVCTIEVYKSEVSDEDGADSPRPALFQSAPADRSRVAATWRAADRPDFREAGECSGRRALPKAPRSGESPPEAWSEKSCRAASHSRSDSRRKSIAPRGRRGRRCQARASICWCPRPRAARGRRNTPRVTELNCTGVSYAAIFAIAAARCATGLSLRGTEACPEVPVAITSTFTASPFRSPGRRCTGFCRPSATTWPPSLSAKPEAILSQCFSTANFIPVVAAVLFIAFGKKNHVAIQSRAGAL